MKRYKYHYRAYRPDTFEVINIIFYLSRIDDVLAGCIFEKEAPNHILIDWYRKEIK